ncbi:uncharacterized protein LOC124114053 [Haliotis rufescens]|uniref:uncharacterized protein LOC124114053 n=1 Tax=Haliotis rufescens TaxID=6454 RepID=UPI001EB07255|nr:uncharacterized protein LOC124114053 [Haliotis rufescens]
MLKYSKIKQSELSHASVWAACMTAFSGFLRPVSFLCASQTMLKGYKSRISGHSFRRGKATCAFASGVPGEGSLGFWKVTLV